MSIKVYFSKCDPLCSEAEILATLSEMPAMMREKIMAYKNPVDRQVRIQGKVLLGKILQDFGLNYALPEIKYTEFNKPFFDGAFEFSIAHSGHMVVCAGVIKGVIGIDIERILDIDLTDYQDMLTAAEWRYIGLKGNTKEAFYEIWTKKEALLKALGRGVAKDMASIDVCEKEVVVNGDRYFFYPLEIGKGYTGHLVTTSGDKRIEVKEVGFKLL